ncbi:MAG TPA: hypothetical protein VNO79_06755, partial [Actinomycetota bacterium]|nr:hypothetical protein [Actinomycetota bacterium]
DPAWPSLDAPPAARVPLALSLDGRPAARLERGARLDAVAPTVAELLGFHRPHPEVRSGEPLPVTRPVHRPRLVLLVAWKGVGTPDLLARPRAWPFLRRLVRGPGGTLRAEVGSLPLDPAAVLTTIGTGGLPSQHGITGTLLRNDRGGLARAFGPGSPLPVIATLAEDLDAALGERPLVGLAASDPSDRGLVGGDWYVEHDRDLVRIGPDPAGLGLRLLGRGFGDDGVPDILGVTLSGSIRAMDRATARLARAARARVGQGLLLVVTATGTTSPPAPGASATGASPGVGAGRPGGAQPPIAAARLVREVEDALPAAEPVVLAAGVGGLFLDQRALARLGTSGDAVVRALRSLRGPGGPLVADAFQGFAVSFARYC